MIKSVKIKNSSSFFKEQKVEFFNSYDDPNKSLNYIFGLSSSGKSSLFNLLKATIYYIRRWITFFKGDMFSIKKTFNLQSYFNPNINSTEIGMDNESCIEIIFANAEWEYKYELRFCEFACNLEHFSYRNQNSNSEWITIFNKALLSVEEINQQYETIFNYEVNSKELGLDFEVNLAKKELNDSVFMHILSLCKNNNIKPIVNIIENIVFFETKNFHSLNNFLLPYSFFLNNKKEILESLNNMEMEYSDIALNNFNKITGAYELNLFLNTYDNSKKVRYISSSQLSKGELKLLILSYLYERYKNQNKIIIVDEFSSTIKYSNFLSIQEFLKRVLTSNNKFQFISWNNEYFEETKQHFDENMNIFNIVKSKNYESEIKQISKDDIEKELKEKEVEKLKTMLNVELLKESNLAKNNSEFEYLKDKNDQVEEIEINESEELEESYEEEPSKELDSSIMDLVNELQDEEFIDDEEELSEDEIARMSKQETSDDDLFELEQFNASFIFPKTSASQWKEELEHEKEKEEE
ncbi:ATP-binding protein [Malacoplasma penetrans]|uniref:ATP-binding protein n=1 Tax=Malacoplasma penetrans TaxID=28227 RepID=UPI00101165F5|nr:ATP-binding protein [Malacoplasma penetrans]RXY97219.1 ATP-binding protein [Malacoplasma penetrans]